MEFCLIKTDFPTWLTPAEFRLIEQVASLVMYNWNPHAGVELYRWFPNPQTVHIKYSGAYLPTITLNFSDGVVGVASGQRGEFGFGIPGFIVGGWSIANKVREVLEWEYLRQARFNRSLSGDFSQPVKHSLRIIKNTGRVLGYAGIGLSVVDIAVHGINVNNSLEYPSDQPILS